MKTIQTEPERELQRLKPRTANFVSKRQGRKKAKVPSRDITRLNFGQSGVSGNGVAAIKQKDPVKCIMKSKKRMPMSKLKLMKSDEVNGVSQTPEPVIQMNDKPAEKVLKAEVVEICQQPDAVNQVIDKPADTVHNPTVNNVRLGMMDKIVETYQRLKHGGALLTEALEQLLMKKPPQKESPPSLAR